MFRNYSHPEGGYVNISKIPGGETNLGVTKRVYEEWGGTKDMKDLTVEDVAPIYKKNYWDKLKGDNLPGGLDLCVFDFGAQRRSWTCGKIFTKYDWYNIRWWYWSMTLKALQKHLTKMD